MSKLRIIQKIFFLIVVFTILSCDQAPLFYKISLEPEPLIPFVQGTPSRMVVVGNTLYVGTMHKANVFTFRANTWGAMNTPSGVLLGMASDHDDYNEAKHPFALIMRHNNINDTDLFRRNATNWTQVANHTGYSIETVYGAGGIVFAGARSDTSYAVLILENPDASSMSFSILAAGTSLLSGAATDVDGNIYLATRSSGIIRFDSPFDFSNSAAVSSAFSSPFFPHQENNTLLGITRSGDTIIAAGTNAGFSNNAGSYFVMAQNPDSLPPNDRFSRHDEGLFFTGALGVQFSSTTPERLLLGVQNRGTSSNQGYRHLPLDANGRPTGPLYDPAQNEPRIRASIGLRPVHDIMQVPAQVMAPVPWSGRVIFAATSRDGLWSYRGGEWNAETMQPGDRGN